MMSNPIIDRVNYKGALHDLYSGLNAAQLAGAYSSSQTYAVGDYCIYGTALYRCKTAITVAEAWNSVHWDAVSIGEDISDLGLSVSDGKLCVTYNE